MARALIIVVDFAFLCSVALSLSSSARGAGPRVLAPNTKKKKKKKKKHSSLSRAQPGTLNHSNASTTTHQHIDRYTSKTHQHAKAQVSKPAAPTSHGTRDGAASYARARCSHKSFHSCKVGPALLPQ